MDIRTILCPIDFSDVSVQELALAAELGRAFGARLVLHHNRMAIPPGLARAWDWDGSHQDQYLGETEAERRMAAALAAVPAGVAAEGVISSGPVGPVVLALAEQLPADLVVLASHGGSTQEHTSVTEWVIEHAPCPVLSVNERREHSESFLASADARPPRAVVPTDFSPTADHALAYACELARVLPLRLDVLHVVPSGQLGTGGGAAAAERAARERLIAAVPADLADRVDTTVRRGDPSTEILAYLAEERPRVAVIGEHARSLVRRWFTRDTTRAVAHAAGCPLWIVPARAAIRPPRAAP